MFCLRFQYLHCLYFYDCVADAAQDEIHRIGQLREALENAELAIYTVVMAGVWQSSGFVMAMFLAGLRGIDGEQIKSVQLDGASTFQTYRRVIIPQLGAVFLSAFVVLSHMAIKSYDLVIALTGGGPGNATELLASRFRYDFIGLRRILSVAAVCDVGQ